MATPASDSTEWDPLGPNAPAGNALVVLRPENAAAKLAFSDVVDFIKEQDNDDGHGLRSRFSRYMWFSDEQVYDPAVNRLVNHQLKLSLDGSSSPSSGTSSDHFSQDVRIWTGFFFLDPNIPPLLQRLGWSVGRLSQKNLALGRANVDLLLTTSRSSQVARRHAFISFSAETRLARVSLESGSSVTNSVSFEDLRYTLEYTPHCHRPEGQAGLGEYVNALHGDDQPTKEALLATPTPTLNSQTIGKYSVTGLIGMGSFGRVRPATDPQRDQLVAIKTIEVRVNNAQAIRRKLDLMDTLSTLVKAEKQTKMLRVIETIHVPGTRIDEFHVILEPFVEITFDKMPQGTHRTKLEIILRDCLQGLAFLHAHRFVHTDIKPTNIGLRNLQLNQCHKEAPSSPPFSPRRLHAVILDIDSIESIPQGRTTIVSRPGTNGTVGFHSPEHESSEYDGRTDIWALGVSFFRVLFGRLPWSYGKQGNPWRNDAPDQEQSRAHFHSKYRSALYQISEHAGVHRDPVCDFLTYAFRFSGSKVGGQRRPRPTGAACLETLFAQSEFLRTRTSSEQALASTPTSTSNTGGAKRPAETESREGQVQRQRSETNCPMHGKNET
ncbi:uncharacterized protein NECHADRAFT_83180 [Fusarium vanettenii 77-13-4]|uniref:Protein kinase domain-containing protein n=1 Tax=Fusarium vanettenii (strain ATCC MYA-4622 / CBS 123669 / FGSC 9596 / NRRL 45880 / 77-13-4) TaxID=660122 RepID=C7ZBH3_FUSV7|nr:uncharacterized protein NECHADRAFT_83180 [Fusarium vanettenii 77-13-4]EEU38737.1 hypothetical protein NECHADRAFT_83180 [Fusarium vanettenii 77-13-4]